MFVSVGEESLFQFVQQVLVIQIELGFLDVDTVRESAVGFSNQLLQGENSGEQDGIFSTFDMPHIGAL